MAYYVLVQLPENELLTVSYEPMVAGEHQIVKVREGDIPDLTKFFWHGNSLSFIESRASRFCTQEAFVRLMTLDELRSIYTLAKNNIDMEIWLDRFKMSKEIDKDDPFLIDGLQSLVAAGIFTQDRVNEILS